MKAVKKGQISIFVILGLVLVIGISLILYVNSEYHKSITDPEASTTQTKDLFPLELYINYCLEKEGLSTIKEYTKNLTQITYMDNGNKIPVLYSLEQGNVVPTPDDQKTYLQENILKKLDVCINISDYEQEGYTVQSGPKNLTIDIGQDEIFLALHYDMLVEKDDVIHTQDRFQHILQIPFGFMITSANQILNDELHKEFDINHFRLEHPSFSLFKRMPYPYSIYVLETNYPPESSKYLKLMFGIEHLDKNLLKFKDTSLMFSDYNPSFEGVCLIEEQCFYAMGKEKCLSNNGTYHPERGRCPTRYELLDQQELLKYDLQEKSSCTTWYDLYTGNLIEEKHMHGESWCTYEPGVGGRFYRLSCIDGQVIVDQCEDYKEEICVENELEITDTYNTFNYSTALCRPNRFLSCASCEDELCCNDGTKRDCVWNTDKGCIPYTEPGMKFWNIEETSRICAASMIEDYSLNQDSMVNCYISGDCGNKMNYRGYYTGDIRNEVQYKEKISDIMAIQHTKNHTLSLPIEREAYFFPFIDTPLTITNALSSVIYQYLNKMDYMMAFRLEDHFDTSQNILDLNQPSQDCQAWTPSSSNKCGECNSFDNYSFYDGTNPYGECTEYKCRSLGSSCIFEKIDGYATCSLEETSSTPLTIDSISITENNYQNDITLLGTGFLIEDPLLLNKKYSVEIHTNKESLCKVSFLPHQKFDEISSDDLSQRNFSQKHFLYLQFPQPIDGMMDKVFSYLQIHDISELMPQLIDIKYRYEIMMHNNPEITSISKGVYALIEPLVNHYLESSEKQNIEYLLRSIYDDKYMLFISCIDRSGKQAENKYISYTLSDSCEDDTPPKIYSKSNNQIFKHNNKIEIFTDEIAECRFDEYDLDFESMQYTFACDTDVKNMIPTQNGSYSCTYEFDDNQSELEKIYVRCKDHPLMDRYNNSLMLHLYADFFMDSSEHNITIRNSSSLISLDVTQELHSDLSSTMDIKDIDVQIPQNDENNNFKKILIFADNPIECSGDDVFCSDSYCTFPFESLPLDILCSYRQPYCSYTTQNINIESEEFFIIPEIVFTITDYQIEDQKIKIKTNGEASCGIRFNDDRGYFQMNHFNQSYIYDLEQFQDIFGVGEAEILCIDHKGTIARKEIMYDIS